jgi:toxic protein SymE
MTKPDCIADCFEPEVFDADNRHFTVSYVSRYPDYVHLPALTLKGQWLETAGFGTGTKVDAKVMKGCIVLMAREVEPEVSELETAIREACKLSNRKQKQVVEFVGVIAGKGR